jgi:transposase
MVTPGRPNDPTVIVCFDEFGPLNLQPRPGRQWAPMAIVRRDGSLRRRRRRATFVRRQGVRHLLAAYDLNTDRIYGHVKPSKARNQFVPFLRYVRSLYPPQVRLGIVLDNFRPHVMPTDPRSDQRVRRFVEANNVELAYLPFYASWLNRIEAQFTALRYFALDGTDFDSHEAQARMIRRYIAWRNHHAQDMKLQQLIKRANVA